MNDERGGRATSEERTGEERGVRRQSEGRGVRPLRAVLASAVLLAPLAIGAQRPTFAPTLFWDSGLINVPAAYASPLGGDLAFSFARLALDSARLPATQAKDPSYSLSVAVSLWGRGGAG